MCGCFTSEKDNSIPKINSINRSNREAERWLENYYENYELNKDGVLIEKNKKNKVKKQTFFNF